MSAKDYNDVKKKYKFVPPDGGWGYMIIVSAIINLSTTTMFQGSFGMLYKEFMEDIGMSSTEMTTATGLNAVCVAIGGYIASPLLSIMSNRTLSFVAIMIYNAGAIGSVFMTEIFAFFICVGVLPGLGLGILYNLSLTLLNDYFVQRRLLANSVTQTVIGLLTMLAPMFVQWSLQEYGYRGTLVLISGINLNNLFGVALIQPVEKNMKKIEVLDNELNVLLHGTKEPNVDIKTKISVTDVEGASKEKEKTEDFSEDNEKISRITKLFDALLDRSLRNSFLLSCVSWGPALAIFCAITYTYMLPSALYAAKWNRDNVALAISLMGFGDLAMRVVFVFTSNWMVRFGNEELYILGVILAFVSRLGMLWSKTIIANMLYITLIGVAHCCLTMLRPMVIADAVPPQKFTAAMGINMLMGGLVNLVLGPAIGGVRDLTGSYGAAFYLIASGFAMVALFWIIELCYKKNKHKRLQRREYLRQKKLNKG